MGTEVPSLAQANDAAMTDTLSLELNKKQRELLLRGLRFVRSSRMLEFRENAEVSEDARAQELSEIGLLTRLLDAAAVPTEKARR